MRSLIHQRMLEIAEKTAGMSRKQKIEYVLTYYWYHLLGMAVVTGLCILLVYHLIDLRNRPVFNCVIVNQEIDLQRDDRLEAEFAAYLGEKPERIHFDSDYQISYGKVQLEDVNEASYEKFFLNWSVSEMDVMILPESFYEYCLMHVGDFSYVTVLDGQEIMEWMELRTAVGEQGKEEKLILAIPADSKRMENAQAFLDFADVIKILPDRTSFTEEEIEAYEASEQAEIDRLLEEYTDEE